jgi:hypothetical protein
MQLENRPTQNALVLKHLQRNKQITPLEALNYYGVFRLGAVIFKLKQKGYNIVTERVFIKHTRKQFARYHLKK